MPRSAMDILCAGACLLPLGSCLPSACHFVSSGRIKGLLPRSQQQANAATQALAESRRTPCQVIGQAEVCASAWGWPRGQTHTAGGTEAKPGNGSISNMVSIHCTKRSPCKSGHSAVTFSQAMPHVSCTEQQAETAQLCLHACQDFLATSSLCVLHRALINLPLTTSS